MSFLALHFYKKRFDLIKKIITKIATKQSRV